MYNTLSTISGKGSYEDSAQEAAATRDLVRVVTEEPQALVSDELVRQVSEAPTRKDAEEEVLDAATALGALAAAPNPAILAFQIPSPAEMKKMGRVELKKNYADNAQKMFEIGQKHHDSLLMLIGSQNLFLAQTVMKVKVSDHIKDALENFAKKAGAACLAAAVAVAALAAAAAKKIGELWDKTKPARDKIKEALQNMARKIAEVTKPAREAIKAAAITAGTELGKAGRYVTGKAKEAGIAIGSAVSAAGEALANTKIGKAAATAARQAGKKMSDLGAKAKIAVAGGLAGAAAKVAKSAQESKEKGQGHFATKVQQAAKVQIAKKKVAALREKLKAEGVSLETRQQAAPYAQGAKPKDRSQGK